MTPDEARKWLERGRKTALELEKLRLEILECRSRAEGVYRGYNTECNIGNSPKNRAEKALLRLAVAEEKFQETQEIYSKIMTEIKNIISQIQEHEIKKILELRYLNFLTIEEISKKTYYSRRSIFNYLSRGISKICTIL